MRRKWKIYKNITLSMDEWNRLGLMWWKKTNYNNKEKKFCES